MVIGGFPAIFAADPSRLRRLTRWASPLLRPQVPAPDQTFGAIPRFHLVTRGPALEALVRSEPLCLVQGLFNRHLLPACCVRILEA